MNICEIREGSTSSCKCLDTLVNSKFTVKDKKFFNLRQYVDYKRAFTSGNLMLMMKILSCSNAEELSKLEEGVTVGTGFRSDNALDVAIESVNDVIKVLGIESLIAKGLNADTTYLYIPMCESANKDELGIIDGINNAFAKLSVHSA